VSNKIASLLYIVTYFVKRPLSSYDCEFVSLAKEAGLPLITEDKKILREFPEIACKMQT